MNEYFVSGEHLARQVINNEMSLYLGFCVVMPKIDKVRYSTILVPDA